MNHGSSPNAEAVAAPAPPRSSANLKALLAVNVLLLILLATVTWGGSIATAQNDARPRGEYTMVAGPAQGTDSSVIYLVDAINQELTAVTYNTSTKRIDGVAYRNLRRDTNSVLRGRQAPGR